MRYTGLITKEAEVVAMTTEVTKYLLTMCYHCEQAIGCETEEKCRACWADHQLLHEQCEQLERQEQQELTTEQLLREYAL